MKLSLSKISIPAMVCDQNGCFIRGNIAPSELLCLGKDGQPIDMLSESMQKKYLSLAKASGDDKNNGLTYLLGRSCCSYVYVLFQCDGIFADVCQGETLWMFPDLEIPHYALPDFCFTALKLCRGTRTVSAGALSAYATELIQDVMLKTAERRLTDDLPFSYETEEAIATLKKCAELFVKDCGCYFRCSVQSIADTDTSSIISWIKDFHLVAPAFMAMISSFCHISDNNIINLVFRITDSDLTVAMSTECKRLSSRTEFAPSRQVEKALAEVGDAVKATDGSDNRYGWVIQRQRRSERERLCAEAELSLPLASCVETGIRNRRDMESVFCDFDLANTLGSLYKAAKCKSSVGNGSFCVGCNGKKAIFTPLSHGIHNIALK